MHQLDLLNDIQPHARWVKIQKCKYLDGNWIDYDNVFTFVASGSAAFILDGVHYKVQEGDAVIIPPGVRHLITSDSRTAFSEHIFHFDLYRENARRFGVTRGRIPDEAGRGPIAEQETLLKHFPMVIRPPHAVSNEIRNLFLKLHKEYTEQRSGSEGAMSAYVKLILLAVYRCVAQSEVIVRENVMTSWTIIQHIVENIQLKYDDPTLSVSMLAELVGYSPNYISALMKANLGVTFHEYTTHFRTEAAKQLLYEARHSMTQIAERVGYSSVHSFSRSFKRETGMSPSQYAHRILGSEGTVHG